MEVLGQVAVIGVGCRLCSGCGPSPLRAGLALTATKLSFGQATTSRTKVSCMRTSGRKPRAWLYVEASCWQLLRGRRPYFDNRFEVAARRAP